MKKETLKWRSEKRKVKDLTPAEYNPRKMSEQERRDLEDSIREFGAVIPIVVNVGKRENVLVGGHQRVTIYADLGIEETDVMVPSRELTAEEEKRLNLRLNKNTGSWDFEKLKDMDLTLLLDVGFGDEELATLWDDVDVIDDEFDVGRAVKAVEIPKTRPGDRYQLGNHILMCGDSTDSDQVKKLMGDELADVLYLDPPYNIGLNYAQGYGKKNRKPYRTEDAPEAFKTDKKSDSKYSKFLGDVMGIALERAKPNVHVFHWCDQKYIWLVQTIMGMTDVKTARVCIWIKNKANPTPQVAFNKIYEPCVYGTRGKPYLNKAMLKFNEVMNKEVESGNQMHEEIADLWLVARDHETRYGHPTQKPVTLAERPLKRCTAPGNTVLDLFGGSGSTLIACEQLGRQCRMMEIDPVFCDVIVNRWEVFTNKKAKKI